MSFYSDNICKNCIFWIKHMEYNQSGFCLHEKIDKFLKHQSHPRCKYFEEYNKPKTPIRNDKIQITEKQEIFWREF